MCFFWSLPITSDEIKRRIWMLNMRFVDFLEVPGRTRGRASGRGRGKGRGRVRVRDA